MHKIKEINCDSLNSVGRSYYCFCIEQALANLKQARALLKGDVIDTNHELARIEVLLSAALEAS